MQLIVDSIGTGLGALSRGDLVTEVTAELDGPVARLIADFNGALAHPRALIGAVVNGAQAIHSGSVEIAQASDDLARRTAGADRALQHRGQAPGAGSHASGCRGRPGPGGTNAGAARQRAPGRPGGKAQREPGAKAYRSPVKALPRTNGAAAVATDSESWDAF